MKEKIFKAYLDLAEKYLANNYYDEKVMVVIRMNPSAFSQMMARERNDYTIGTDWIPGGFDDVLFVNLCGIKMPMILDNSVPEDIGFILQHRKDYERLEIQKLHDRFYKMFNGDFRIGE